ncbi:hypothetical protein FRC11_008170, partial [Ceratobasidium sp. 423]
MAVQLAARGINQPQPWTAACHHAILALHCAHDHCPFASAVDPLHTKEVQMLCPGTLLPTAAIISNYVWYIYEGASCDAALYLKDLLGALHLAVDGWTCPTSTSFLGIIVFWEEDQVMWQVVLEFLTKSHMGKYMAKQIEDCLKQYGIKHKAFTLPFFPASSQSNSVAGADDEEWVAEINNPSGDMDPGKFQYDQDVMQGVTRQVLQIMAASGLCVSAAELACAHKLIPKVAGLVQQINDSPQLENLFCKLIDKDPELQGSMCALACYVVTCWNTVLLMLQSYSHFRGLIQYLTGNACYKVSWWALDTKQWSIMEQLGLMLEVFKEPTNWMSWSGVLLVSKVVPELLTVWDCLYDVQDDTFQQNLHPTVRVAAEASLLVFEKYMGLTLEESDVHIIAIELYPNTTQEAQSQNNPQ